jgi:hypothetical protein
MKAYSHSKYLIAALPALLPSALWLTAKLAYNTVCPKWCLKCVEHCSLVTVDLSALMVIGLIYSPLLLLATVPVSVVLISVIFTVNRRRHARSAA